MMNDEAPMMNNSENYGDYDDRPSNYCQMAEIYLNNIEDALLANEKTQLALGLYSMVAIFGAIGNLLVISAVMRNAEMRSSPRNFFIISLALSDFLMCSVTVPFTMRLLFVH